MAVQIAGADTHTAMAKTYRYLRGGMVGAVLLLAVALAKSALDNDCVQTSISGYYYTPVRSVFVGVMMIMGFALIVLRGRTTQEDIALNLAGFLAPIVAIMPTTDVGECGLTGETASPLDNGELAGWVVAGVDNNLWALLFTAFVGVVATGLIGMIAVQVGKSRGGKGDALTRGTGIGLALGAGVIAVAAVVYSVAPEWFRNHAHGWSALAMFVVLGLVAFLNSYERYTSGANYRRLYRITSLAMLGVAIFCAVVLRNFDYQILVLEAGEIFLFGLYWSVQTVEHWDDANPRSAGSTRIDAATT